MSQRELRQHAAAVRARKRYQQERQAHLDFLTATVLVFCECRTLNLNLQLWRPEFAELCKRLQEAEECESTYLCLRLPSVPWQEGA